MDDELTRLRERVAELEKVVGREVDLCACGHRRGWHLNYVGVCESRACEPTCQGFVAALAADEEGE